MALFLLKPGAAFDVLGIAAALGGAVSMAAGTVLTRRWQLPASPLTVTAWQLTAGGMLLLPVALRLEPALPPPTVAHVTGFLWLGLIGAALTYILWFRGLARIGPSTAAALGFLSPVTAVILGWGLLGQDLGPLQIIGMAIVLGSVWVGSRPVRSAPFKVRVSTPTA